MLLRALLHEVPLQRRDPIFPIPPILIGEIRHFPHRFRPQRDMMLAPDNCSSHEPCSLQHANVLGHCIEGHVERLRELRHCRVPSLQPSEHSPPRRVAQRGEHSAQRCISIINHTVEY